MKRDFKTVAGSQLKRDLAIASAAPDRFERAEAILSGPPRCLEPSAILPRLQTTRPVNVEHVAALVESVRALGLIEPVVVDVHHRLLSGSHRLAAIQYLQEQEPDTYSQWFSSGVPVHILDVDAERDPNRALELEIAENEHRRDYSPAEVRGLVDRLKAAGYRDTVGRPKTGEKALGPALGIIVRKSMKTLRKMLAAADGVAPKPNPEMQPLESLRRALVKHRAAVPEHLRVAHTKFLSEIEKALANG